MSYRELVEKNGFAIVPEVIRQRDIDGLLVNLARLNPPRSRAGVRHAMRFDCVADLAYDLRLLELSRAILGAAAVPFRATLFDKSPVSNWLVVWHQDTALPLTQRRDVSGWGPWSLKDGVNYAHAPASALSQVLALRIHLDDSEAENGPLRVLPGTHNLGVLTDEAIHDLSTKISAVECLVPKGGVLAMRPTLVHASSKSRVQSPRRVLHFEYAASRLVDKLLELALA